MEEMLATRLIEFTMLDGILGKCYFFVVVRVAYFKVYSSAHFTPIILYFQRQLFHVFYSLEHGWETAGCSRHAGQSNFPRIVCRPIRLA